MAAMRPKDGRTSSRTACAAMNRSGGRRDPAVLFVTGVVSVTAGVVTLIVFLVYTQIENHILNPIIMSRTVRISPLLVLVSVLVGASLEVMARDAAAVREGRPVIFTSLREDPLAAEVAAWVRAAVSEAASV